MQKNCSQSTLVQIFLQSFSNLVMSLLWLEKAMSNKAHSGLNTSPKEELSFLKIHLELLLLGLFWDASGASSAVCFKIQCLFTILILYIQDPRFCLGSKLIQGFVLDQSWSKVFPWNQNFFSPLDFYCTTKLPPPQKKYPLVQPMTKFQTWCLGYPQDPNSLVSSTPQIHGIVHPPQFFSP